MAAAASWTQRFFRRARVSERHARKAAVSLPPPTFPQAVGEVLNLAALGGDAVRVSVQAYPECNVGDRITLKWIAREIPVEIARRHGFLADPIQDFSRGQYEIRVLPLWALPPGDYEVHYTVTSRTGNSSRSDAARVTVVGTPPVPTVVTGGVIQTELFGVYPPGILGAWIVPGAYAVASSKDVLVQSLAAYSTEGASAANVALQLCKNDDEQPFARVESDATGKTWIASVDRPADFVRGDRISVRLEGVQDSAIFLVLAV